MAGLSTGAGAPVVKVYHEKSMILPDVSRVLACLYEKDVKFECVKDSYKDILRLQATRSVPVPFYDGPTFLQESRAICRYIAETYEQRGYPFLLGKDVLERASIEQWLRHEEHAFDPPSRALFCHLAFPLHDEDNGDINREKRKLEEVLEVYEQRLGESEFLAGNEFTLADLVHLPNTHHIVTSEKFAYLYDSRKNVQRWWNTISARDSWQQVLWDMKSVEEQYQMEELEKQQRLLQQQQQWQTEHPPTSGGRSIDELAKTAGVDTKPPPSTPKQTPTDARNAIPPVQGAAPSADGISDKQSDKSTMDERAPEMTPRQAPPSDTATSASIQEEIMVPRGPSDDMLGKTSGTGQIATPAASKSTPARGEVPDVRDTGDDTTKKPAVDTKAAPTPPRQEPVSQTTEHIKGVAPTSHGITGDELANIAMADESATPPAPEAVKPSVADPRGMPTTPRRPAPTPDTQRHTTSDQASDQAPPLPSLADTRNKKTGIAEAGRTNTIAPDEQPGGRIPKNAGAPAAGPSPMKSQKNMNEAYNDGPSIQQLSSDQSRAQLAENKTKQGDDTTSLTEIGKPKEDDFLVNANQNNTGQAQVTSTDGPSKLQTQSDQNKPISSKDIGKQNNETVSYRSSATSREMLPSVPEKSMGENQLQGDKSSISLQDNVKQGSEAALSVSGTEQPKKRDLLANADQNSGKTPGEALQMSEEQTTSDTQQMKSNTSNSKSDGPSKPTQFDGNEGNLPESQRRGSSTNP